MPFAPFVVGQWVRGEKFYGRTTLVEEILEGPKDWVWLLGTRRIGKTSTLKQLELLTGKAAGREAAFFPIYWNFQGVEDPQELHSRLSDALVDAEERLEGFGIRPQDVEGADVFDCLGRLRRKVRVAGLRLLLLCDEVEALVKVDRKDSTLIRRLHHEMQKEEIRPVFASTIRLWQLAEQRDETSQFLQEFTPPFYIRGLADEEARALIRQEKLPKDYRPRFDDGVVEEIRVPCNNHPYLIQLVCKRYMETADLGEAIEQVATDQMVSHFFSEDFKMLSGPERDILRIIAESSSASSDSIQAHVISDSSDLVRTLQRLEQLGYLRRNAERRFELANFFFRRWFREQPHSRLPQPSETPPRRPSRPDSEDTTEPMGARPALFDNRYSLLEELGRGATGVVYKAYDETLRGTIAIKILKPEYTSNPDLLKRFRQEVLLAREIGHPNILKIYHLGETGKQLYLTMKCVEGPTLGNVIREKGALPIGRAVEMAWKLASALEAAHGKSVIHRDIKPGNILLDKEGEPYVADFGLARLITGPGMTSGGVFLGTPDYASPEQARLLPADERSDIYSMGVVIFEMVTGKRPFAADSVRRVLDMHIGTPAPDPRRLRPEVPSALSSVILVCLEKKPSRRYPTAAALRLALEEIRKG